MKQYLLYLFSGLVAIGLIGCSSITVGGNEISIRESQQPNPNAPKVKYAASIRIAGFADGRKFGDARKVGIAEVRVAGMHGAEIRLDRDVTDVVADSLRKRLDDAGFQMLAREDQSALFELSGVVREFSYDAKVRDHVLVSVETTLRELGTGKVVWSGEVVQQSEHFAGVSGNNKDDIATYLHKELGVVTGKTVEAIGAVLMATRPDLFNLVPGTKAIPGVTVYGTSAAATSVPVQAAPAMTAGLGLLLLNTTPARAKVYLDGVYFGLSPLRAEVAAGTHAVDVKLNGFKPTSEKVSVRKGETTELELTLEH